MLIAHCYYIGLGLLPRRLSPYFHLVEPLRKSSCIIGHRDGPHVLEIVHLLPQSSRMVLLCTVCTIGLAYVHRPLRTDDSAWVAAQKL